jgi:hypothetical protein
VDLMDPEGELQHAASGSRGRSSVVMPHTMSPEAYTSDMRDEPPVGFSTLCLFSDFWTLDPGTVQERKFSQRINTSLQTISLLSFA